MSAPSGILQPSLDAVQQTLASVKVEKWKKGSVRDEAGTDIHSILRDMQVNLPPLLKEADAAPGSLSKVLPVSRNVDALYDVLLRVVEAARMAAPDEQANQLRQALSGLGNARLDLDKRIQEEAAAQETQLSDLQASVQKQAAFKCPAPPAAPACPAPAPAKKPKKKPSPSATTTTPPTNNLSNPATGSPKNGP
jgi:hypothetical protein